MRQKRVRAKFLWLCFSVVIFANKSCTYWVMMQSPWRIFESSKNRVKNDNLLENAHEVNDVFGENVALANLATSDCVITPTDAAG